MPVMYTHQDNGASRALCGARFCILTNDPQAVDCPACIARMELQPA